MGVDYNIYPKDSAIGVGQEVEFKLITEKKYTSLKWYVYPTGVAFLIQPTKVVGVKAGKTEVVVIIDDSIMVVTTLTVVGSD